MLLFVECWRGSDEKASEDIFLELVQFKMTRTLIDYHAITFCCLNDIVIDKSDTLVIANVSLEDLFGFCVGFWELNRSFTIGNLVSNIFFARLDVVNGDAGARAFGDGIPVAAKL